MFHKLCGKRRRPTGVASFDDDEALNEQDLNLIESEKQLQPMEDHPETVSN